jgi:DNA-binding MarR family transcriptional regulator
MVQRNNPVTTTLGVDLLSVAERLSRLVQRRGSRILPLAQARLLAAIAEHGGARISELAAFDLSKQPSISRLVRDIEEVGMVTRSVDPGDGRAALITITPHGRSILFEIRRDQGAAVAPLVSNLSTEDRATLAEAVIILDRLLGIARSAPALDTPSG